jgi:hypothetical protein
VPLASLLTLHQVVVDNPEAANGRPDTRRNIDRMATSASPHPALGLELTVDLGPEGVSARISVVRSGSERAASALQACIFSPAWSI